MNEYIVGSTKEYLLLMRNGIDVTNLNSVLFKSQNKSARTIFGTTFVN